MPELPVAARPFAADSTRRRQQGRSIRTTQHTSTIFASVEAAEWLRGLETSSKTTRWRSAWDYSKATRWIQFEGCVLQYRKRSPRLPPIELTVRRLLRPLRALRAFGFHRPHCPSPRRLRHFSLPEGR